MEIIINIINSVDSFVWGIPMIVILLGTHLYMTIRTRFIQRKLPTALKLSVTKDSKAEGDISMFASLCASLSSTLGVGCIVGVATAIMSGGPGAVFWMWISGILGMATKYSETFVSLKYRVKDQDNKMLGGAMFVWTRAFLKKDKTPWWAKTGAVLFAVFTVIATLGIGSSVQATAISDTVTFWFPNVAPEIVGLVIVVMAGLVVVGGVKAISRFCERLAPVMTVLYIAGCITLIIMHIDLLGSSLGMIFECAFTSKAAFGGAVGSGIAYALQYGLARGLFSNESGMGTAPIFASAAATKNPARQSLVAMTSAFWSTVVICAITGLALVCCITANPDLLSNDAGNLTTSAFCEIPFVGGPILALSIIMFAFTSIVGWSYYADRCLTYLINGKAIKYFLVIYLAAAFMGACKIGNVVWNFSDIMNAFMAIPNILVMLLLSGIIAKETKYYVWDKNLDNQSKDKVIKI